MKTAVRGQMSEVRGLVMVVLLMAWGAFGAEVVIPTAQLTGSTNNRPVTITSMDPPHMVGSNVVAGAPVVRTPTNSIVRVKLLVGNYRLTLDGLTGYIDFYVPDTNGVVNFMDLASTPPPSPLSQWYTRVQSDGRFYPLNGNPAGFLDTNSIKAFVPTNSDSASRLVNPNGYSLRPSDDGYGFQFGDQLPTFVVNPSGIALVNPWSGFPIGGKLVGSDAQGYLIYSAINIDGNGSLTGSNINALASLSLAGSPVATEGWVEANAYPVMDNPRGYTRPLDVTNIVAGMTGDSPTNGLTAGQAAALYYPLSNPSRYISDTMNILLYDDGQTVVTETLLTQTGSHLLLIGGGRLNLH